MRLPKINWFSIGIELYVNDHRPLRWLGNFILKLRIATTIISHLRHDVTKEENRRQMTTAHLTKGRGIWVYRDLNVDDELIATIIGTIREITITQTATSYPDLQWLISVDCPGYKVPTTIFVDRICQGE